MKELLSDFTPINHRLCMCEPKRLCRTHHYHTDSITSGSFFPISTNCIDSELTQCLVFLGVAYYPRKTWPKCPSQFLQTISVR
jgi:hypothetical protein